jgi:hypothetical protein
MTPHMRRKELPFQTSVLRLADVVSADKPATTHRWQGRGDESLGSAEADVVSPD